MATITEALNADRSMYEPIEKPLPRPLPFAGEALPAFTPFMRCPMPPINPASADAINQFNLSSNRAPSTRMMVPNTGQSATASATKTSVVFTSSAASGSSSSSSSSTALSAIQQASITVFGLDPNGQYTGVIQLAKSFLLVTVAASSINTRVQLYGTPDAQLTDLTRPYTTNVDPNVADGIISDMLVTGNTNYVSTYVNTTGSNGDSPQTSTVYVTITNVDVQSSDITVTIAFVPLES